MNLKTYTLPPLVASEAEWEASLRHSVSKKPRGGMVVEVEGQPCVKVPVGIQGRYAIIDLADYPLVGCVNWTGTVHKGATYAFRYDYSDPKNRRRVLLHTLITGYAHCDHINRNGLDNRRCNLRPATHSQNMMNRASWGACAFKGVRRKKGRWQARIMLNKVSLNLGSFKTSREAALAYDAAARERFGEYARPNFPWGTAKRTDAPAAVTNTVPHGTDAPTQ